MLVKMPGSCDNDVETGSALIYRQFTLIREQYNLNILIDL